MKSWPLTPLEPHLLIFATSDAAASQGNDQSGEQGVPQGPTRAKNTRKMKHAVSKVKSVPNSQHAVQSDLDTRWTPTLPGNETIYQAAYL